MPKRAYYAELADEDKYFFEMFIWRELEKLGEITSDNVTINSLSGDEIISFQRHKWRENFGSLYETFRRHYNKGRDCIFVIIGESGTLCSASIEPFCSDNNFTVTVHEKTSSEFKVDHYNEIEFI